MRLWGLSEAGVRAGGRVAGPMLLLIAIVATAGSGTGARALPAPHPSVAAASTTGYDKYSLPHRPRSLPAASAVPAPAPVPKPPVARAPARTVTQAASRRPAPTPPPLAGSVSAAEAVFAAINASRSAAGLPAVRWSAGLSRSAHLHNLAMAAADQLSHQLPGEASLGARISAQGVQWTWAAENVALSSNLSAAGALGLEQNMVKEAPPNDEHRLNILTTVGTMVGVDAVFDTIHHLLWLTEDFAT
jgi:uncharacterized protein YkwD